MKFRIPPVPLARALQYAGRLINAQTPIPVLSGIQMTAHANQTVHITSTDLITQVVVRLPADVEEPGTIIVAASTLTHLASRIPPTIPVRLHVRNETLQVHYGKSCMNLKALGDGDTLPEFPDMAPSTPDANVPILQIPLSPALWASIQRVTAPAIDREESATNILRGVGLTITPTDLIFESTDRSRIASIQTPNPTGTASSQILSIPAKAMLALARWMDPRSEDAPAEGTLTLTPRFLRYESPAITLTTRLIEGTFPNLRQAIPQTFVTTITVPTDAMRYALERTRIMTRQDHMPRVTLSIQPATQTLEIQSPGTDIGEALEYLEMTGDGEALTLTFNPQFLIDALSTLPDDTVTLRFAGAQAPVAISDASEPPTAHYVLPMRSA